MGLFRLVLRTVLALSRTCFGTIREHTGGKLFPFEARTTAAFFFTQPLCLANAGFFKTLVNIWQPDPKEPEPVWQRSDYVAMVIVGILLVLLIGFWPA